MKEMLKLRLTEQAFAENLVLSVAMFTLTNRRIHKMWLYLAAGISLRPEQLRYPTQVTEYNIRR